MKIQLYKINIISNRLGFKSFVTIPELAELFPELDYVDHMNRIRLLVNII